MIEYASEICTVIGKPSGIATKMIMNAKIRFSTNFFRKICQVILLSIPVCKKRRIMEVNRMITAAQIPMNVKDLERLNSLDWRGV